MASVPAGLASLTQAVADLTTAVQASVAKLADLSAQLAAVNSEDPQVVNLAAQIETEVKALNDAVTPPPTA